MQQCGISYDTIPCLPYLAVGCPVLSALNKEFIMGARLMKYWRIEWLRTHLANNIQQKAEQNWKKSGRGKYFKKRQTELQVRNITHQVYRKVY